MLAPRPLFFVLGLLYVALPGHPFAALPGLPLGLLGTALALVLAAWWIGLPDAPPRARTVVAGLAILGLVKVAVAVSAPSYGLAADYRTEGATVPERSTEWRRADWTRIDATPTFASDEFPVHFFNDVTRFNYYRAAEPRRDLLPFDVRWVGQFYAEHDGRYTFALESNGTASLTIGNVRASIEQAGRLRSATVNIDLAVGLHPFQASYRRPDEQMPWLSVAVGRTGAAPAPSAPIEPRLLLQPSATRAGLASDMLLRPLAWGVDIALLALLGMALLAHLWHAARERRPSPPRPLSLTRERGRMAGGQGLASEEGVAANWTASEHPLLALYVLAASTLALAAHLHLFGRAVILSGGNDWLAYEGFARAVLLDGPLLTEGRPLGQGAPYYYQPLYIYWLALVHLVLGEGLFGPLLANALLGIAAGLGVYALGRELFGRLAGGAALLAFELCRVTFFAPTAGLLLSENLLIPLVPIILLLFVRAARGAGWGWLVAAGVALGLGGLARTTPLALLPPALLVLAVAFRRRRLSGQGTVARLAVVIMACSLTVGVATVRNYVVAGRPVPITSSAGANLWETHRPSSRVDLSRIDRDPLYERLGLDRPTREVAEFVRQDPLGYVGTLVPMFLYAVGVVGAVSGTSEVHLGLAGMCAAYALTSLLVPRARSLPTLFMHGFVWSHLAQMTVFFSHQYGFRLILPMYVAMAPVVGLGIWTLLSTVLRLALGRRRTVAPALVQPAPLVPRTLGTVALMLVGAAVLGVGASPALTGGASSLADARESFYGMTGDAALAARQALRLDLMRQADSVYFAGDDGRSASVAYLRGLAFPTMRWFDGARGIVFPPPEQQALYVLPDRAAADVALRCIGDDPSAGPAADPRTGAGMTVALASREGAACTRSRQEIGAPFEGAARILGLDAPASIEPGRPMDITVRWEPLARPRDRARPTVRLVDSKGRRWGGPAEVSVYPSSSWRPGELVVGLARLDVDPTLPPGEYGIDVGVTSGSASARLAESGAWGQRGQSAAHGGSVRLISRSTPLATYALPLPSVRNDMLDGVRFLGAVLNRDQPKPGERLTVSLFWQNAASRLADREVSLIMRDGRSVVHEWRGVPVDGTYPTSRWKPSEIVRDTWDLVLPATMPSGAIELAVGLAAPTEMPSQYLGLSSFTVQPVARTLTEPSIRTRQEARFGEVARLVGFDLRQRRVKPGDSADLTLIWQALAEGRDTLAVGLYLLDGDDRTVAQSEEEPAGGRRPTAGWTAGEFVEDAHELRVPRDVPRGRYRVAVGLVADDRRPLLDEHGQERVVLQTELAVE